jgi:hypothetical protein
MTLVAAEVAPHFLQASTPIMYSRDLGISDEHAGQVSDLTSHGDYLTLLLHLNNACPAERARAATHF